MSSLKSEIFVIGQYHPIGIVINNFILPIAIFVLFKGLITETTYISKVLSFPFIQLLGRSSYAFYLIHKGVIIDFIRSRITENLLIDFILLNILAIMLYFFIEEPLNRWIRSLKSKTQYDLKEKVNVAD